MRVTPWQIIVWLAENLERTAHFSAVLNDKGDALLIDTADPTGPNGQRSFVVEFTVREV